MIHEVCTVDGMRLVLVCDDLDPKPFAGVTADRIRAVLRCLHDPENIANALIAELDAWKIRHADASIQASKAISSMKESEKKLSLISRVMAGEDLDNDENYAD